MYGELQLEESRDYTRPDPLNCLHKLYHEFRDEPKCKLYSYNAL